MVAWINYNFRHKDILWETVLSYIHLDTKPHQSWNKNKHLDESKNVTCARNLYVPSSIHLVHITVTCLW